MVATRLAPDMVLAHLLSLLPARKITFLARHHATGMDDIEKDERDEHWQRVEDILILFVIGNAAGDSLGVLDEAEYYTNGDEGKCYVQDIEES